MNMGAHKIPCDCPACHIKLLTAEVERLRKLWAGVEPTLDSHQRTFDKQEAEIDTLRKQLSEVQERTIDKAINKIKSEKIWMMSGPGLQLANGLLDKAIESVRALKQSPTTKEVVEASIQCAKDGQPWEAKPNTGNEEE